MRAKANGNVTDLPEEQARGLITSGIYEEVEADEDEPVKPPEPEQSQQKRAPPYKRRDMRAEQ